MILNVYEYGTKYRRSTVHYIDFRKSNLKCNYSGHIVNILTLDLLKVVFDQI